ncbi:hypothetical protein JCM4814A_09090 [Streptomyces phaeofaciens JCM 4814]|uniref:Uncharacterized protein n=1 Tax=Streptomyces phaeofaciens TaxID=68254 RepID=A0A918HR46_9ACTN|nr:hypothetical protein [Streptomyces phaeofaciens]GGT91018.1 hypothetical protein GCM10010226_81420 [Streptomyces phaeofaciens]
MLITAGMVGAGASVVVGRLPAVAIASAALAGVTWWAVQRRRSCSCALSTDDGAGCGCGDGSHPLKITNLGDR